MMATRMCMTIARHGIAVTYRCYKLPGRGRRCKDKDTDKCLTCKYSKAEMSGRDATRLLNSYGRKEDTNDE